MKAIYLIAGMLMVPMSLQSNEVESPEVTAMKKEIANEAGTHSTRISRVEEIIDLKKIVERSEKEVEAVLGKPSSKETTKYGPKRYYRGGEIEVVYINGVADWITVEPEKPVPYSSLALAAVGLDSFALSRPTFANKAALRWEPCGPLRSVQVNPDGKGGVFFIYVKAVTP